MFYTLHSNFSNIIHLYYFNEISNNKTQHFEYIIKFEIRRMKIKAVVSLNINLKRTIDPVIA